MIRAWLDGQLAYTRDARVKNGRVEVRTVHFAGQGRDFTLYKNGVRMGSYFLPNGIEKPKQVYIVRNTTLVPDLVRELRARNWTKAVAGMSFGDLWIEPEPESGTGQEESHEGSDGA